MITSDNVIQFPNLRPDTTLLLPSNLARMAELDELSLITIVGTGLEQVGIFEGDQALCKTSFSRTEIGPTTVCIVHILETGEKLAKKVVYRKGLVILKSFRPEIEAMTFRPDEVEVSIIIQIMREPDANGRFDRTDINFTRAA